MFSQLRSAFSDLRDKYTPVTHTSTFRSTGQITPEEFVQAGNFLVYKFPSWSWASADSPSHRVSYLPEDRQYLVTKHLPCYRRLSELDHCSTAAEKIIYLNETSNSSTHPSNTSTSDTSPGSSQNEPHSLNDPENDVWVSTGIVFHDTLPQNPPQTTFSMPNDRTSVPSKYPAKESIPDIEEEERLAVGGLEEEDNDEMALPRPDINKTLTPTRQYNLYITYSPYYRTPKIYLAGYLTTSEPLSPHLIMEDIMGEHKDKTVTLEDFPFFDTGIKMASVHPCKHASVMKILLDRADMALKRRISHIENSSTSTNSSKLSGADVSSTLVPDFSNLDLNVRAPGGTKDSDVDLREWEVLRPTSECVEPAIRVDQYLIVFLKFIASVTPGIEHDFTVEV